MRSEDRVKSGTQGLAQSSILDPRKSAVVFAYHNVGYRCLSVLLAHGVEVALVAERGGALPLSEAEQASIRKEVAAKAGAGVGIAFLVDPDLLGGLKIRIGDRVIDGSVAGRIGIQ